MFKKPSIVVIAVICLSLNLAGVSWAHFPEQDRSVWTAQGRIDTITTIRYSDGRTDTRVVLNVVLPQDHQVHQIAFYCDAKEMTCPTSMLGSCQTSASVMVMDNSDGTSATYNTMYCQNRAAADCWSFSGYMTPTLWATSRQVGLSCLY